MEKYQVFPADANGYCIRGFCPTLCKDEKDAQKQATWLVAMMFKYNVNYHHIEIQEL